MTLHPDPQTIKACCAVGYSSDVVSLLLGNSYHPGGLTLTRRLLDQLALRPGQRLLDVASGRGTTCLAAAAEYGLHADGVDLAASNVTLATEAASTRGLADRASFHHGDAEALPLADQTYDAVVCECALCTFPDKVTALAEMTRVLRSGGRLGITDITADLDRLPAELTTLGGLIACVADARTTDGYRQLLADAGLRVTTVEPHQQALNRMLGHIEARMELLRMTARPRLEAAGIDLGRARLLLGAARDAVRSGILGYVLVTAEKPWDRPAPWPSVPWVSAGSSGSASAQ